jgi:hypothetical protein
MCLGMFCASAEDLKGGCVLAVLMERLTWCPYKSGC